MGQSNMRDYADHYARVCGAVEDPGLCRRRHRLRRRQQCAADGARLRGRGRRRPVHQRPGVPQPLRLPAGQADHPGRADARQAQGRARCPPRSRPVHRGPHRCGRRDLGRGRDRALPVVHGSGRRHGQAHGPRHHSGDQARAARNPLPAHGDALAGGRTESAQPRRAGSRRRRRRDLPVGRAVRGRAMRCATSLRTLKSNNSLAPCQTICCRSRTITTWSASSRCWRARRPTTRPPPPWCRSARRNTRLSRTPPFVPAKAGTGATDARASGL